jgi:hypothetical protein
MTTKTEPKQLYEVCIERNATRKEYFTALVLADDEADALEQGQDLASLASEDWSEIKLNVQREIGKFAPAWVQVHDPVANPPTSDFVIRTAK